MPRFSRESLLPQFDAAGRLIAPGGDWSELAERPDLSARIREGLEHLDDRDRAAFVLRVVYQVPLEEAAELLRIPPAELRERSHRACLTLTGFLARLAGAADGECASLKRAH